MLSNSHRNLLVVTAAITLLLVVMGSIVCVTDSSRGCPDWPRCHGGLVPPMQVNSIIEYTHRVIAIVTGPLILACAIVGLRRKALGVAAVVAFGLTIVVAIFGAYAVLTGLPPVLAAIDLGSALLVLAIMVATTTVAFQHASHGDAAHPTLRNPLARVAITALAAVYAVFLSGVLAAQGTVIRCLGGPMSFGGETTWQLALRHVLATLVAGLVLMLLLFAFNDPAVDRTTRRWVVAFGALYVVEVALVFSMMRTGPAAPLLVASATTAAGMWSALVVVTTRAVFLPATADDGLVAAHASR
ncbi:MAG: COX15/CtaA family protein [Thermoanaerobaculia bacterium]